MGVAEVEAFLTHLAVAKRVSASTQNQAKSAILFPTRRSLGRRFRGSKASSPRSGRSACRWSGRARKSESILAHLSGTVGLMIRLLYGTGLRIMECVRRRISISRGEIVVRQGKGGKDRMTMLPQLAVPLKDHLLRVKKLHEADLEAGYGEVYLPDALSRKYPGAPRQWAWQYVFPSRTRSVDPRSGGGAPAPCGREGIAEGDAPGCATGGHY